MSETNTPPLPTKQTGQDLNTAQNRCLALAAVFQAATLVTELAQNGQCDELAYQSLIESLFVFEPENTLSIYGDSTLGLEMGLKQLHHLSQNSSSKNFTTTAKYALSLISLQKHASKDQEMLTLMRSRLQHMQYKQTHFSADNIESLNADLASSLSGLYQDTLSTLKFRIQVQGNMEKLTNTQISDKIRALLFAGFRSALLWRQLGGTKWQLIFKRADIERVSQQLLEHNITTSSH